ncbi:MAG: hypothetical protein K5679_05635 [Lachnospiraceae bacterium]|nr:hypothetical protein [Lachnospiraceae bacterium]
MSDLQEYKCPCCGGAIEFNSTIQKMKCPFCETEFEMDALKSYDEALKSEGSNDFTWETSAGAEWNAGETDGMKHYQCKSCGGEIIGDANMAASECPYCGNPITVMSQFAGGLKPDYVIPFKLNKEAAMDKFAKHLKGKKLLPRSFTAGNHLESIKGIYVPYWLFDTDVDANIRYKATKKSRWEDSKFKYERTDYFSVVRSGKIGFDKVPVDGSTKMDDTLMESLEPYKFKEAVPFQTAYLAGYMADKYDVDAETSVSRANERVKVATERAFKETVEGYDSVDTENSTIQLKNGVAKYALYPVWILNTTWNDQKFVFAMNGQTGKFVGNLPCDKSLLWKNFFLTSGVTFVAGVLVAMLLGYFK